MTIRYLHLSFCGRLAKWVSGAPTPEEGMGARKTSLVILVLTLLSVSFPIFLITGYIAGYLLIFATMLSLLEPEGLGWTLATGGAGLSAGTAAFLLFRHVGKQGLTTLLHKNNRNE